MLVGISCILINQFTIISNSPLTEYSFLTQIQRRLCNQQALHLWILKKPETAACYNDVSIFQIGGFWRQVWNNISLTIGVAYHPMFRYKWPLFSALFVPVSVIQPRVQRIAMRPCNRSEFKNGKRSWILCGIRNWSWCALADLLPATTKQTRGPN